MNSWTGTGNVCGEPEVHTTNGGTKKASFTLAVQRRFANAQGVREADFIPIVVWRQLADLVEKYVHKGMKVGVEGYIQRRDYDAQDGTKRTVTEIVADNVEFLSAKPEAKPEVKTGKPEVKMEDLVEEQDDQLPF